MFVLTGKEARAEIREQSEIDSVIRSLKSKGYTPLFRSMLQCGCESLGLPATSLPITALASDPRFRHRPPSDKTPMGEILHKDDNLFYIQPKAMRLYIWEIRHHKKPCALDSLVADTEAAIRSHLDGRRVRGMSFDWKEAKPPLKRFVVRQSKIAEDKLNIKEPEYTEKQLSQAKSMVSKKSRDFIIGLAQLGKARTIDAVIMSETEFITPLLENEIIRREYLIICRQDSKTLCSAIDKNQLDAGPGATMKCTTCGRFFKDELIQEIYALTEAGKALVTGSNWMTIWITDLLIGSGISKDKIKWNLAAGDDEIDIVAEVQGMNVFFELKDREFGLGDAYPFSFRVDRYGGDVGVILTMDKVAPEAKKFITEQSQKRTGKVNYIEGDSTITKKLPDMLEEISKNAIEYFIFDLLDEVGVGVLPLVKGWLNRRR